MALIDNISEIKQHNSAISAGVDLANLQSFIDDAINDQLIPKIGLSQVQDIELKKAEGMDDDERRLLLFMQKAIVGFAIANYSDNGSVILTNAGISVAKSNSSMPASDKKLLQLRRSNTKSAYAALEQAVLFLESKPDVFTIYADSDERTQNLSLLINNSADFQKAGIQIGNDAQLFNSLLPYVQNATDNYITPLITEDVIDTIINKIKSKDLSELQKKLLKKIQKPLAAFTMVEAIPYRAVTIDSNGIFQLSETIGGESASVESKSSASEKRLAAIMTGFTIRAEQELESLRQFLNNNATDLGITAQSDVSLNDGSAPNVYYF